MVRFALRFSHRFRGKLNASLVRKFDRDVQFEPSKLILSFIVRLNGKKLLLHVGGWSRNQSFATKFFGGLLIRIVHKWKRITPMVATSSVANLISSGSALTCTGRRPARRGIRLASSVSLVSFTPIFSKMQARDFFVEFLRQNVNAGFVGVLVLPEIELGQNLIGKRVRHDEARMTGGATEIHQPAFGQHENLVAIGEGVFVHLRFDVGALDALGARSSGST